MDNRFQHMGFANHDFYLNAFESSSTIIQIGHECHADTTLRLHSPDASSMHMSLSKGADRKSNDTDGSSCLDDVSSLDLGLGRCASSPESKESSATARTYSTVKPIVDESFMELGIGNDKFYWKKLDIADALSGPKCDLELSLSTGPSESVISSEFFSSAEYQKNQKIPLTVHVVYDGDGAMCPLESRSVLPTSHGYMFSPPDEYGSGLAVADSSSTGVSLAESSVTCTSGFTLSTNAPRSSNFKKCQFNGCSKGARGASGLCIAHCEGRRCQKLGCNKGAEGRTVFCKAHGGGRCCNGHGGGKRCSFEGKDCFFGQPQIGVDGQTPCDRFARGKAGLCATHSALVQDNRVHGGGTIGPAAQNLELPKLEKVQFDVMLGNKAESFVEWDDAHRMKFGYRAIPVAMSLGVNPPLNPVSAPEGRVHGGSLLAMLVGVTKN